MKLTVSIHKKETINLPPIIGDLWALKTIAEYGKKVNNSFCAIHCFADSLGKTAGQTDWTRHNQADRDFILALQLNDGFTLAQKWQWACQQDGTVYRYDDGVHDLPFRWPRIVIGSRSADDRNHVQVIDENEKFVRIAGLMTDFYIYKLQELSAAGLVQRCNCEPQRSGVYSNTPKGVFWMPIFDPRTYEHSKGETELWIEKAALFGRVR